MTPANRDQPYHDSLLFISAGFQPQMAGDVHTNLGLAVNYPCPVSNCTITSRRISRQCNRCSGWVYAKCAGLLNTPQYRRSNDRAYDPCSASPTKHSPPSPPPTPAPPAEQTNDTSTYGARFTVFGGKPATRTRWMAGTAPHKSGICRNNSRCENYTKTSLDLRYLP